MAVAAVTPSGEIEEAGGALNMGIVETGIYLCTNTICFFFFFSSFFFLLGSQNHLQRLFQQVSRFPSSPSSLSLYLPFLFVFCASECTFIGI